MSAPRAPDPYATAQAQQQANIGTASANSVIQNANQYGPWGSRVFNQIGTQMVNGQEVPRWEQIDTLSPEQQRLFNQQMQLGSAGNELALGQMGRLSNILNQPINMSGLPQAAGTPSLARLGAGPQLARMGNQDYEQSRQRVEQAMLSRIAPQQQQDRSALSTRLRNQGLVEGSEAFNRAMDQQGRQENDARMQAVLAGGQEQSRLAGLDQARLGFNNTQAMQEYANAAQRAQFNNGAAMSQAEFQNTSRERALQELLMSRNQPLNEISALMSGGQVSMPQFTQYRGGQVANTDIAGLINQNYQQRMGQHNAMMGGLAGIGGSLLMAPMTGGGSLFGNMMGGMLR